MTYKRIPISIVLLVSTGIRLSAALTGCTTTTCYATSISGDSDTFSNIVFTQGDLGDTYTDTATGITFADVLGMSGTANPTGWPAGTALTVFLTRDHPAVPVRQPARSMMQLAVADPGADAEVISADDSGFILLPNAESISPNEEVDVVRVEVPRSAIVALGLPLTEETATEKVTADIALGADGLAHAVRILE